MPTRIFSGEWVPISGPVNGGLPEQAAVPPAAPKEVGGRKALHSKPVVPGHPQMTWPLNELHT